MTTHSNIEAREVSIAGKHLRCQICDYTRFYRQEASLQTGARTFGQDWADAKANCYVCEQCGFVHWFARTHSVGTSAENSALAVEIEDLRKRLEEEYEADLETTRN